MAAICTVHAVNIQTVGVLPTVWMFMYFVWIWEQTEIISLYSINWLVCITETECVYCAVRTGYLNVIQFDFRFQKSSINSVMHVFSSVL